jgi:hypothetical protein
MQEGFARAIAGATERSRVEEVQAGDLDFERTCTDF